MHPSAPKDQEFNDQEFDDLPSKTRLKQDMEYLQSLGERLATLPAKEWQNLDLPEALIDALKEAKRLTSHGAIRRQKQYIGKLMRHDEPEPIEALLAKIDGQSDEHNGWLHRLERLRTQLLADENALEDLLDEAPQADIQHLRQMIRQARKEQAQHSAPRQYRALFQYLKELFPAPELSHTTSEDPQDDSE